MTKYELRRKISSAGVVERDKFIQQMCSGKHVLDLGCIRHSAEYALADPGWIHNKIKSVASKVVGVDYLPEEIEKLTAKGYDIIFGDVTKPIDLNDKFDVIVAGDLIEHLVNFEGFFENCSRLLNPDGVLLISTPNPFYSAEFHFVAFKGDYLINPEHTCWIDPQALSQLSSRFDYRIDDIHFVNKPWKLSGIITETENNQYNILSGKWDQRSIAYKLYREFMRILVGVLYLPYRILTLSNTKLVRYSDYVAVLKKKS